MRAPIVIFIGLVGVHTVWAAEAKPDLMMKGTSEPNAVKSMTSQK